MFNPFEERIADTDDDRRLIEGILGGSRADLEKLVFRHQAWIYNIAFKMVADPADAEDVTQEILIKIVTKLSSYDPLNGAFRTWVYRIVANHVINMRRRKHERHHMSLDDHADVIARIPDDAIHGHADNRVLIEEVKIKCWTAMLLCLDRRHRLVYILGEIFDVKDGLGSEIMDVSPANYRQMLSRGRKKIYHFMTRQCGLIHPDNPCHCGRKMQGFKDVGFVDEDQILFFQEDVLKVKDVVREHQQEFDKLCSPEIRRLFREHPFYETPGSIQLWIKQTFASEGFQSLISPRIH